MFILADTCLLQKLVPVHLHRCVNTALQNKIKIIIKTEVSRDFYWFESLTKSRVLLCDEEMIFIVTLLHVTKLDIKAELFFFWDILV